MAGAGHLQWESLGGKAERPVSSAPAFEPTEMAPRGWARAFGPDPSRSLHQAPGSRNTGFACMTVDIFTASAFWRVSPARRPNEKPASQGTIGGGFQFVRRVGKHRMNCFVACSAYSGLTVEPPTM